MVEHGEPLWPTIRMCLRQNDSPDVLFSSQENIDSSHVLLRDKYQQAAESNFEGAQLFLETDLIQPIHPEATRYALVDDDQYKYKLKSTSRVMRQAMQKELPPMMEFRLHLDGGANMSVTCDQNLLINYKNIKKHAIAGIAQGEAATYATGLGYLPWRADYGETLLVKCFYSAQAADTIVSPTDVVINRWSDYNAWSQYANVDEGRGYVAFYRRNDAGVTRFSLNSQNGLWFHHTGGYDDYYKCRSMAMEPDTSSMTVRQLTKTQEHVLWHKRLGCPGETAEKNVHKHVDGCPVLRGNAFFRCKCCMEDKATYKPMATGMTTPKSTTDQSKQQPTGKSDPDATPIAPTEAIVISDQQEPVELIDPRDIYT
mmetsp:Transcript_1233/g.1892  ORF Transcript_1233/g.1892 Transcript_1233/m.1892 type:complete len:370 (+) Transcript_1233:926-2035(+)